MGERSGAIIWNVFSRTLRTRRKIRQGNRIRSTELGGSELGRTGELELGGTGVGTRAAEAEGAGGVTGVTGGPEAGTEGSEVGISGAEISGSGSWAEMTGEFGSIIGSGMIEAEVED